MFVQGDDKLDEDSFFAVLFDLEMLSQGMEELERKNKNDKDDANTDNDDANADATKDNYNFFQQREKRIGARLHRAGAVGMRLDVLLSSCRYSNNRHQ
jgi:hypothetical protein